MAKYKINGYAKRPEHNLSKRSCPIEYIVIHYTGGTGSAYNNVRYFRSGDRQASADFFIDDESIWRFNPNVRRFYSWHCGDGHGKYGITNANSIGIEVVSNGEDFSPGEIKRLRFLVMKMMDRYGIPKSHVVRHYDASRKECPAPYIDREKWQRLKSKIVK